MTAAENLVHVLHCTRGCCNGKAILEVHNIPRESVLNDLSIGSSLVAVNCICVK